MQEFIHQHRPLILKHARNFVRVHGEKIPPEDVARELELVLSQLGQARGVTPAQVASPDGYLRAIVLHAARRAKRRHTIIEQIAAGDDLGAVTEDLRALDADLPDPPAPPSAEAVGARTLLDELVHKLSPRDALVHALLLEDDAQLDDVALALAAPPEEIAASLARILQASGELRIEGDGDRRGRTAEARREEKLRELGRTAGGPLATSGHLAEPLLALVRGGDQSDDLADALAHLAGCPDCRAVLTEGRTERKAVVVMAIEAPRTSAADLSRAADEASARLFERGDGRWTAVVPADKSQSLVQKLERPDSSVVSRIGMAEPVELPGVPSTRRSPSASVVDPVEAGTDASEVQAWAHIARVPKRKVAATSAGWTAFAFAAVLTAIGIAYILATR